jgi:hypothetical protein
VAIPTYEWRAAPAGLATKRQLGAEGLRPGGQPVVALVRCRKCLPHPDRDCILTGHLYRRDLAKPKRVPTLAQEEALDKALAARQTCTTCRVRQPHCLSRDDRRCADCTAGDSALAAA